MALSKFATKLKLWFERYSTTATLQSARKSASRFRGLGFKAAVAELVIDDMPNLASPATLAATSITATTLTLTWAAVTSATGYIVERATNAGFTTGLVTRYTGALLTFNETGLTASTQYHYRVRATATGFETSTNRTLTVSTIA